MNAANSWSKLNTRLLWAESEWCIQTFKNLESERGEVMEHNIIFDLVKADQKYVKQYQDDCVFNASIKLLMEGSFSIPTVIEVVSKLCQLNDEREKQLRDMHESTLPLNVVADFLKHNQNWENDSDGQGILVKIDWNQS